MGCFTLLFYLSNLCLVYFIGFFLGTDIKGWWDSNFGSQIYQKFSTLFIYFYENWTIGVTICVNRSCLYRVNVRILSIFANPNSILIINLSIFANPNSTHLLFVLGGST